MLLAKTGSNRPSSSGEEINVKVNNTDNGQWTNFDQKSLLALLRS